LQSRVWEKQ